MVSRNCVKMILSFFICSIICVFFSSETFAFSGTGGGINGNPYDIATCSQLQEVENNLSAYYQINNDIDCNGVTFSPIATSGGAFSGNFNGNNYAISNITINSSNTYIGFFAQTSGATITNVRIVSGTITSTGGVVFLGGLVGSANGTTITHSSTNVTLNPSGTSYTGGLVGYSGGSLTIQKSFFTGTINDNGSAATSSGLVGVVQGGSNTISDSYTAGTYYAASSGYAGGLVGIVYSDITVTNSYSSGTMNAASPSYIAGFIGGFFAGSVTNSFAAVTGSGGSYRAMFGVGNGTSTGNYYDTFLAGTGSCSYSGSANCTAVNSGNSTPNYFKNNSSNSPLSNWNFSTVWQTVSGGYPTLQGFSSPAPIPTQTPTPTPTGTVTPTPTATPVPVSVQSSAPTEIRSTNTTSVPVCGDAAPVNPPDLFQIDVTSTTATLYYTAISQNISNYYIAYGYSVNDMRFSIGTGNSNRAGVLSYTINALSPNTEYYFVVRGQNGCMTGTWSNAVAARTIAANASGKISYYKTMQSSATIIRKVPSQVLSAQTSSSVSNTSCEYMVRNGDSLWQIAVSQLGDGFQYQSIMNKNNIPSTVIYPGQRLKIRC